MVEQRSPKPSVACSTRVSPAKHLFTSAFLFQIYFTLLSIISQRKLFMIAYVEYKKRLLLRVAFLIFVRLFSVVGEFCKIEAFE